MKRRDFFRRSSALAFATWGASHSVFANKADKMARVGMSTVTFRHRFKQTKPDNVATIENELTLKDIPAYYKSRFKVTNLEFWAPHFESLEKDYLETLRQKVKSAGSKIINIQADVSYDLANQDESERQRSITTAKQWVDAAAFLGSTCVRINPGNPKGSVENSIKSLKEINGYTQTKKIILLTENHFGIEMDPAIHLRIIQEAGPKNIYTLPDFGNYPRETMYESLAKIMPYAYMMSAKTDTFNEQMEHVSYDFDRCVQMAEKLGFKGIYSVEQWGGRPTNVDPEKIVDWMIEHVKKNIS